MQLGLDAPGLELAVPKLDPFCARGFRVSEILAHEPPRIGGVRKMRPFKTGWEITQVDHAGLALLSWPHRKAA